MDVLGVVAAFEDDDEYNITVSVIATRYGFARQPTILPLGVWVRATLSLDRSPPEDGQNFLQDQPKKWFVLKSRKISPPISTRVVTDRGIEKLLVKLHLKNPKFSKLF